MTYRLLLIRIVSGFYAPKHVNSNLTKTYFQITLSQITRLISTDEKHSKQYLRKHTFPFSTMFIEWNVYPRRQRDLFDMSTN